MPDLWPRWGAILLCSCVFGAAGCGKTKTVISVGAKDFTEQAILGEIFVQHLTSRLPDVQIDRRFGMASTHLADSALKAGNIDIYPEYSCAALTTILGLGPEVSREVAREQVREGYRRTRQCEWLGPLGFDNGFALVVRKEIVDKLEIQTLSQAAERPDGWSLGVPPEFQDRIDGLPLLIRHYHMELQAPRRRLPPGKLYPALLTGEVSMIAAYATDAALDPARFTVLQDDKRIFPPCEAGIVARIALLQSVAGLADALKALNGKINTERIRAMNHRVEADRVAPGTVAADFLKGAGL